MQKFNGSLIRQFPSSVSGNAAAGVQVTVYLSGTNTLASIYEDNEFTAKANPVTTLANGFYSFKANDGKYRLQFSNGFPSLEVQLLDAVQFVSDTESGAGLLGQAASAAVQSINEANNEVRTALDGLINSGFFPAVGSFESGGTITERNQFLQLVTTSGSDLAGGYTWGGPLPKVVSPSSTPSTSGGLAPNAWTYRSDATIGAALVAGTQDIHGQPASTISYDVLKYGAVPDLPTAGAANAAAFAAAFAASRFVTSKNAVYYITDTIEIGGVTQLDLPACTIVTSGMAGKPLFRLRLESPSAASEQFSVRMGGGSIVGDAAYIFEFVGVDASPSPVSQYARIIKVDGVTSASAAMRFMKLPNAVKSLHISNVWHSGGMFADTNGKVVETHIVNSVIFGSGADENGFFFESGGGSTQYSEGFHLTNSTIDGYTNAFNIRDMFSFTLDNSSVRAGLNALLIRAPVTTHNREYKISGVLGGRITFEDAVGGVSSNSKLHDIIFSGAIAPVIIVGSGWSGIDIDNIKAESNGGAADNAVWVKNGCNNVKVNTLNTDTTFGGGVLFTGSSGSGCEANNIKPAIGRAVTSQRPIIQSNPGLNGVDDIDLQRYSARLPIDNSVPVGDTFGTVLVSLAKGQAGKIIVSGRVSGCADGQTLLIDGTAPLSLVGGAGWSSAFFELPAGEHSFCHVIPFICKSDQPSLTLGLTNNLGNTVAQNSAQAFIAVIKDL